MHIMRFPPEKKRLMKKTHLVQLAGAYLFSSCNVLIHYRITPPLFIYLIIRTPHSLNYNRAREAEEDMRWPNSSIS